jgi:hypothetical protein
MAAALGCSVGATLLLAAPPPAGAASPRLSVTVSPSHGLTNGQWVTVTGKGFPKSGSGSGVTWFVTECTTAVRGRLNASTDAAHCDVTSAKAVHLSKNGRFTTRYRVETGIIGDGYCGTAGHLTCVIGVGTASGSGAAFNITFRGPPA